MNNIPKFDGKYRADSQRLSYDAYTHGLYFVTICTKNKVHYFGKIVNDSMNLNLLGQYAESNIQNIAQHYPYACVPLWVIMPNHLHLIIQIQAEIDQKKEIPLTSKDFSTFASTKGSLAVVVRGLKSAVTKYAHENNIVFAWQARYYDRIVRNAKELNNIAQYIENNPALWALDAEYTE